MDMKWIKKLILENQEARHTITGFANNVQWVINKEYQNIRIIAVIVYRSGILIFGYLSAQNNAI